MADVEMTEYRESVRPAIACPYEMCTDSMVEMSYGIVWEATLMCDGRTVGTVEDRGDGGGAWPRFASPQYRNDWEAWLAEAYPQVDGDASETAITHLTFIEDDVTLTSQ